MKIKKELRQLNNDQLQSKLIEMKKQLMKLNAQRSTGTALEKSGLVRTTKRTIALIYTLLQEKENNKEVPK